MTTATGCYCKMCGYDLRASAEAKRCPECGRAFSSDDPKSFRPRPFAAPWKRALGRWAKRGVIALLALGILLGGVWGWCYWGWRQEQTALAEVGGIAERRRGPMSVEGLWTPVILGGEPGRWLHDRRIPGSFVLMRVHDVELPENATNAALPPLRKLPWMKGLMLQGRITAVGMAQLRGLPGLVTLRLNTVPVTDAGFEPVGDLSHLEELDLYAVPITGAALVHVAKLSELKRLRLRWTLVTDAGLVHLESLGKLASLDLQRTQVTDAGLVHIEKLMALRTLDLSDTSIADAGLVHLEKLTGLEHLELEHTRVTDAGLVHLEKLTGLRELNLSDTSITDVGLVHLAKVPTLERVFLLSTKTTRAGVAKLQAALPGCEILGP